MMVDTLLAICLTLDLLGRFLIVLTQARLESKLDVNVLRVDLFQQSRHEIVPLSIIIIVRGEEQNRELGSRIGKGQKDSIVDCLFFHLSFIKTQLSLQYLFLSLQGPQLMNHFSQLIHVNLHNSTLTLAFSLIHLCLNPHSHVVYALLVAFILTHSLGGHFRVLGAVLAVLLDQLDGIILQDQRFFIFMTGSWFLLLFHHSIRRTFQGLTLVLMGRCVEVCSEVHGGDV